MSEGSVISKKRATKKSSRAWARITDQHPKKILHGKLAIVNISRPGTNNDGKFYHCEIAGASRMLTTIPEKFLSF